MFLAKAGIKPLLAGSMGEGLHLSHSERIDLIRAAREALDDAGFTGVPVIIGTGAGSTRETIQLSKEAAEAGADYVIVITPGYFAGVLAGNKKALKAFFTEVAEKSPVPVIVYNCGLTPGRCCGPSQVAYNLFLDPGASAGIDLDSNLIIEIAKEAPNTVGVKLTYVESTNLTRTSYGLTPQPLWYIRCGNVGKLTRICATVSEPSFASEFPRSFATADAPFLVLGGFTDFIVPSLAVRAHGAITGLANVSPVGPRSGP